MKTITFAMSKGGAGKSSLAIGIASVLHSWGKRTLVLDLDEQASLARWIIEEKNAVPRPDPSILSVEGMKLPQDDEEKISAVVERLAEIDDSGKYDYLLVDTKGEQARLTAAIGAYSDFVLAPTNGHSMEFEPVVASYVSLKSVIEELGNGADPDKLFHVVLTKRKTIEARDIRLAQQELSKHFQTIAGPMESSSYNMANEFGTTIDILRDEAKRVMETTKDAREKANARREFERHQKALAVLEVMMNTILKGQIQGAAA